ncbi:MAG: heavy metal translocating P-type ATPase [Desulfobulbus sp.]
MDVVNGMQGRGVDSARAEQAEQAIAVIAVDGMSCVHCRDQVERAALEVAGVREARVDLDAGLLYVRGGEVWSVLRAVREAGYPARMAEAAETGTDDAGFAPVPDAATDGYRIDILGMHCAACVARVERALLAVPGVQAASVNLIGKEAVVRGGEPQQLVEAVLDAGYGASLRRPSPENRFLLRLDPLPDSDEQALLLDILQAHDPAARLRPDGERFMATTTEHPADIVLRLTDIGYQVVLEETFVDPAEQAAEDSRREIRRSIVRALVAAVTGFGIMAGQMHGFFPPVAGHRLFWAGLALLCLAVMLFSGGQYYLGAWRQARRGAATMDTLVALGTGAAWLASVLIIVYPDLLADAGGHLYLDASVMILAFLQCGHVLEVWARRTTSEAVGALVGLRARTARVVRASGQADVPVSLLRIGDRVQVRPGEKVPIDGVLVEGKTTIDEFMLTGEPLAVMRRPGDPVVGGTINRSGAFVLRVTRLGEDTTLARIIQMVHAAQMSKPPIGRLVDRVAAVFVPMVVVLSVLTYGFWLFLGPEPQWAHALTTSIAVLVIACPCALGLATPIAVMVGSSRAAQLNVLIRNSDALQTAASLTHVVLDKTGTLTRGRPTVRTVFPAAGYSEDEVLLWAASLERGSEHPLAVAVLNAWADRGGSAAGLHVLRDFIALPGLGVQAVAGDGQVYRLGSDRFLEQEGIELPRALRIEAGHQADQAGTPIWLARGKEPLGLLILADPIRDDAAAAVRALQKQGMTVVMCTGDNQATAAVVARELGIDEVHSELLPEDKGRIIRTLQEQGARVGMVGDGINDAPALADIGFAMGRGVDVAVEHADVVLVGDSLLLVSTAVAVSSATLRTIRQNLFGACVYNALGLPLAAGLFYPLTGWLLEPVLASAAMALSSVTVVVNANRLRFFQPR